MTTAARTAAAEDDADQLDRTFAALSDRTRRAILRRLAAGEATVTELAAPLPMSQPAVSKHLKVLEEAGLVTRRRDAQRRPCRLEARPLRDAAAWLAGYRDHWEGSYRRLDRLLNQLLAEEDRGRARIGGRRRRGARRGADADAGGTDGS
ncbi:MAG TPA: metalloregulator ArsR/SmtB family transcription factor [Acidimicrobiales bacterium]